MAEEVKVFGMWASLFSGRIELAMKLKGIPYEYMEEDLENKSPLLLQYNPIHKKVPVLLHNGNPIAESLVILEYIDETWKNYPILPQDPYNRAMVRFWAKFIDEKLTWTIWGACIAEEKNREKAIEEASEQLKMLENELKDKKFFGGDHIGYLDIAANIVANFYLVMQEVVGVEVLNEEKFPILFKWIGNYLDSAIVKECLPPPEKQLAYTQETFKKYLASK